MWCYIILFTYVPYTIKEDVGLDGNQLASGAIYSYIGGHEPCFYVKPFKRQKYVTVSMKTVDITNLEVKVKTQNFELPQGNKLPKFLNSNWNYKTKTF